MEIFLFPIFSSLYFLIFAHHHLALFKNIIATAGTYSGPYAQRSLTSVHVQITWKGHKKRGPLGPHPRRFRLKELGRGPGL